MVRTLARRATVASAAVGLVAVALPAAATTPADITDVGRVVGWGTSAADQAINGLPGDEVFTALAAGNAVTVGLTHDGRVLAAGTGAVATVPEGAANGPAAAIAVAIDQAVAVLDDGSVRAWGRDHSFPFPGGERPSALNVPAELPALTDVAITTASPGNSAVGLTGDGHLVTWGKAWAGTPLPTDGGYEDVALGDNHGYALRGGDLTHFGATDAGQEAIPAEVADGNVVDIAAQKNGGLALLDNGKVYAWGANVDGGYNAVPEAVSAATIVDVDAKADRNIALGSDGTVYAWGSAVSAPELYDAIPAEAAGPTARGVVAGPTHFFAMHAAVRALGAPTIEGTAQVGETLTATAPQFSGEPGEIDYVWYAGDDEIAGQNGATLALTDAQLGAQISVVARAAAGGEPVLSERSAPTEAVVAGEDPGEPVEARDAFRPLPYELAGVLRPWGTENAMTNDRAKVPEQYANTRFVKAMSSASLGTVALTDGGRLVAWGGTRPPQQAMLDAEIVDFAMDGASLLAVTKQGTVIADQEPGTGLPTYASVPDELRTLPAGASPVVSVAVTNQGGFAVRADGTVVAWGRNASKDSMPTDLANVHAIVATNTGGAAVLRDGTVRAWGDFVDGLQPGDGVPQEVLEGPVRGLWVNGNQGIAVTADGTVHSWGTISRSGKIPEALAEAKVVSFAAVGVATANFTAVTASGEIFTWTAGVGTPPEAPAELADLDVAVVGPPAGDWRSNPYLAIVTTEGGGDVVEVSTPSRITGTPQVGQALTGVRATFTGVPDAVRVEWRDAASGQVLGTEDTYTPGAADVGKRIVFVTIASVEGQADVVSVSDPTAAVVDEGGSTPVAVDKPSVITGVAQVGQTLTGKRATFTGEPAAIRVEWRDAASGEVLGTEDTYTPGAADVGKRIVFVTIASAEGQDDVVSTSAPTAPVVGEDGPPPPGDGDAQGITVTPDTVAPGGQVTVQLNKNRAGQQVSLWLFPGEIGLGTFTVGKDGTVTATIPKDLKLGSYQLGAYDSNGELIGWAQLNVTADGKPADGAAGGSGSSSRGGTLGNTGADASAILAPLGLAVLLAGAVTMIASRQRRRMN